MSGVSVAAAHCRLPFQQQMQPRGMLAERQLAVLDAQEPDWFMGNSLLVEQVLREVRTQLPEPNSADVVAELNALLSPANIACMLGSGQTVSAVVSKVCSMAQQIVDAAEERAAQRSSALQKSTKKEVRFKLKDKDGSVRESDLTDEDRALIERRLRELHELQASALERLEDLRFEEGAWRIALPGTGRFVMVPKESIRITDVKEIMLGGKRLYEITVGGLPEVAGGALAFGLPLTTQRFEADSRLVKELGGHERDAAALSQKLQGLEAEEILAHVAEERQRLMLKAVAKDLLQALERSSPVAAEVDADALCTLAPNAPVLGAVPPIDARLVH